MRGDVLIMTHMRERGREGQGKKTKVEMHFEMAELTKASVAGKE